MHSIPSIPARIKTSPAVHDHNGTLCRVLRGRPRRNRRVQRHNPVTTLGAVGWPHGYDLSDLPWMVSNSTKYIWRATLFKTCRDKTRTKIFMLLLLSRIQSTMVPYAARIWAGLWLFQTSFVPRCIMTTSGRVDDSQPTSSLRDTMPVARMPPWPSLAPS